MAKHGNSVDPVEALGFDPGMILSVRCDTCGKPATRFARDTRRSSCIRCGYVKYVCTGPLKAGCDEHPVESVEVSDE